MTSGFDLKLSAEQMQELIGGAILSAIGPEQRDTLVKGALAYLLTPPPTTGSLYSGKPAKTPLQVAFENAIERLAQRLAYEYIESHPDVQAQILELFSKAWLKMIEDTDGLLTKGIADRMSKALAADRY